MEALRRLGHPADLLRRLQESTRWTVGPPRQVTMVWEDPTGAVSGSASAFAGAAPGVWSTGYVLLSGSLRGSGIGTALIHATAEAARSAGCRQAFCFIAPGNLPSTRAHERVGYVGLPVGRSGLVSSAATSSSLTNGPPLKIEPVTALTPIRAVIEAAGIESFADLSTATPMGSLAPPRAGNILRRMLNMVRGRRSDRAYLLRSEGQEIGFVTPRFGLYQLILRQQTVASLSPSLLARLEEAVRRATGDQSIRQFALLHSTLTAPPPHLTTAFHQVFAVDLAALRAPPPIKQ
ncbi:MAG: GNAT family N-acetyltransferase [Gemmatimonadota bacterium]